MSRHRVPNNPVIASLKDYHLLSPDTFYSLAISLPHVNIGYLGPRQQKAIPRTHLPSSVISVRIVNLTVSIYKPLHSYLINHKLNIPLCALRYIWEATAPVKLTTFTISPSFNISRTFSSTPRFCWYSILNNIVRNLHNIAKIGNKNI